jgi:hypothetical protein
MNVLEAVAGKMRLGWDSPVSEVVNPAFIELNGRGGLGWLKGFNELVTRCGYEWVGHPGGATLGTSLRGGLLLELRTDLLEFGLEVIERTLLTASLSLPLSASRTLATASSTDFFVASSSLSPRSSR